MVQHPKFLLDKCHRILTRSGVPEAPEPSEKHGLGEGQSFSLLREVKRGRATGRWPGAGSPPAIRQAKTRPQIPQIPS